MLEKYLKKDFIYLDGGMGTMLQKNGLVPGKNPESFSITHPEIVAAIHRAYLQAGCDIIYTNTFGASGRKLDGTGYSVEEIVTASVNIAKKEAAAFDALVALDIGPLGALIEPVGHLGFDEAYELFREMAVFGEKAGADLAVIETVSDLQEARAALLAVKENTALPVFVTMTFEESGRTFTGCLPEAMAITLTGLGADAIGVNCSVGPRALSDVVRRISAHTDLPLIVKPNAGLPDPKTGEYDLSPKAFAEEMSEMAELGAKIVGGCCGTTPEFIMALKKAFSGLTPARGLADKQSCVCGQTMVVTIHRPRIIGERINPTGKKKFQAALRQGDMDYIINQGVAQQDAGADILDVNVGLPGIDEVETMKSVVTALQGVTSLPLQIDSNIPAVIEAGLRYFAGKAIVNSVSGDKEILDRVLPIVKKYGAAVVGLAMDSRGIPESAEARLKIAKTILDAARSYGIEDRDVFIDCLTLTVSAQQSGAAQTLKALEMVKKQLGLHTVLGVSNISFGLPNREIINRTFLALALEKGLDLPIMNPNLTAMTDTVAAYNVLSGIDDGCMEYIEGFSDEAPAEKTGQLDLASAVAKGLVEQSAELTQGLLATMPELEIINNILIPALDRVGNHFEKGSIFLPQLMKSADASCAAFEILKKSIKSKGEASITKGKIIIATVKGDIHDIGKNIVKTVLENYGYQVLDLGRDVPPETIVQTAIRENVYLIGLSALMTTTLGAMEDTITALRASGHKCKIFVGGAVLTESYAMEIGADYYAKDAKQSADIAKEVLG